MKGSRTLAPTVTAALVRRFYNALPLGKANAVVARHLAPLLELEPAHADRTLRALAESAVIEYDLLVSTGNAGYYRPASRAEAEESIGWKASQAARMFQRVRAEQKLIEAAFPPEAGVLNSLKDAGGAGAFHDLIGEAVPLLPDLLPSDTYHNTTGAVPQAQRREGKR